MKPHPRDILLGAQAGALVLPVCDHYSGVPARMKKSLQLQAEMTAEFGTCVFDVTLDSGNVVRLDDAFKVNSLLFGLVLGGW